VAPSLAVRIALIFAWGGTGLAQQYSFRHYGAAEGLQNLVILSLAQLAGLAAQGVMLISTGGTAKALRDAGAGDVCVWTVARGL